MSEKKTIVINPDLFKVSKQTRRKRDGNSGEKSSSIPKLRIKENHAINHNKTTKNQILKYIRQQQQQKYDEMLKRGTPGTAKHDPTHTRADVIDTFETDFKQSLDFLNSMVEKNQTTVPKTWNSTLKNTNSLLMEPTVFNHVLQNPASISTDENVNIIVPDVFSQPQRVLLPSPPQYGCLKGGNLPTYRSWNTAKNMSSLNRSQPELLPPPSTQGFNVAPNLVLAPTDAAANPLATNFAEPMIQSQSQSQTQNDQNPLFPSKSPEKTLQERLKNPEWLTTQDRTKHAITPLHTKHAIQKKLKELQAQKPYKPNRRQRKTVRRTFVLGKSKHYPKIGVLVSNKTLRKQIGTRGHQLKQVPIDDVRKALIKKGLIKVGSIAPNDVLRKMYETMNMMCGDLHNHNPDNLIYNYMNGQ
jgi:hypothetical protein